MAQEELAAVRNYLERRLPGFTLEREGTDFSTDNYFFRFHRKGQSLRIEITPEARDDLEAGSIIKRLDQWHVPEEGDKAVCVRRDGIEPVPFYPWEE